MGLKEIVLGAALALGSSACKSPDCETDSYPSGLRVNCERKITQESPEAKELYSQAWLFYHTGGILSYDYSDNLDKESPRQFCSITFANKYFKWTLSNNNCDELVDHSEYHYILREDGLFNHPGLIVTKEDLDRKDNPKLFEETYDTLFKKIKYQMIPGEQ